MTEHAPEVIDYGAFQHPSSSLFRDYLLGRRTSQAFYEDGWGLEALDVAVQRALSLSRGRSALADTLERQQELRGAPRAAAQARRLRENSATAIVTGQQAGLFGGPLFVLYKAQAAIKVARTLEQRRRSPVVPVFWVASEDHDFAEVRSATVIDESGQIRTLRYEPHSEPVGQPASKIILDETIVDLLVELRRTLPQALHQQDVVDRLTRCYRPGVALANAFAEFLSLLLPDLVVLDPSDPGIKALMRPILCREILENSPTSRLASEVGPRLLAAGYHQQVPVRPGFLSLFLFMEGQRRALASENGQIEVRGVGKKMTRQDAARLVDSEPALWSPGVLLRPLVQDFILPTAAYIGGPAEMAYHAQIGPAYGHFGIPRPALLPRPSVTLIEPSQKRALEAERLGFTDLQADPETLRSRWAREEYPEVEEAFTRARHALEREMKTVQETLGSLDPTLHAAAHAALGRALHPIDSLYEKSTRALKKRDLARADRLRRTRDALLPGGAFQERGLSVVGLLARHGPRLLETIDERMDPWAKGHQLLHL